MNATNPSQSDGASTAASTSENDSKTEKKYTQCIFNSLRPGIMNEKMRRALTQEAALLRSTPSPNTAAGIVYACCPVRFASHTSQTQIYDSEYVQTYVRRWLTAIAVCSPERAGSK